ncbi:hypothetical protein LPJGGPFB_04830 [Ensifer adhaerens]|nr:hypothetical protein [Ensifer adhaerens]
MAVTEDCGCDAMPMLRNARPFDPSYILFRDDYDRRRSRYVHLQTGDKEAETVLKAGIQVAASDQTHPLSGERLCLSCSDLEKQGSRKPTRVPADETNRPHISDHAGLDRPAIARSYMVRPTSPGRQVYAGHNEGSPLLVLRYPRWDWGGRTSRNVGPADDLNIAKPLKPISVTSALANVWRHL